MFLKIRSKNESCAALRKSIKVATPTVFRLGSVTPTENIFKPEQLKHVKEINSVEGCKISGNKLKMKLAFADAEVITSKWMAMDLAKTEYEKTLKFPAIIKHINSSQGNGIYFIEDNDQLQKFCNEHNNLEKYIIEEYLTYSREYRLHITEDGCFYSCRKMLKEDAEERWHRHENNSVWILEENPLFDKPSNWEAIVQECVKAMKAVKLDVCAIDIKVQSNKHKDPKFIILETNSAPALAEIGINKYKEQLTKMILK